MHVPLSPRVGVATEAYDLGRTLTDRPGLGKGSRPPSTSTRAPQPRPAIPKICNSNVSRCAAPRTLSSPRLQETLRRLLIATTLSASQRLSRSLRGGSARRDARLQHPGQHMAHGHERMHGNGTSCIRTEYRVHKSITGAVPQMAAARALADAPLRMDSV